MENITCTKCASTQFVVQKRGYSLKDAMTIFFVTAILLVIGWVIAIASENSENRISQNVEAMTHAYELSGERMPKPIAYEESPIFLGGTVVVLGLTLFTGTVGADKNQRVCVNCGDITVIGVTKPEVTKYHYLD
jgi:ribosomal protein S27AE